MMDTITIATILLVGTFLLLVLMGTHIAFSISFSTIVTTLYLGIPLKTIAQNMVSGVNVFVFLAVPFFITAGEIMGTGGISNRLIKLSNALVGWIKGGLAHVNILASMFFGGISGSSTADVSSIGAILIPMMEKDGYDSDFSTCVTIASSIQGILIPPSHNMIIYALVAGSVSIGRCFLAGIVPGVFLGVALMIYSYIISVKRNYPGGVKFSMKEAILAFRDAIWGLGTVLIVVVGVIGGIFTATEAAAIAAVYAFIVTFVIYREIKISAFWGILTRSIKTISIIMILVAAANAFGWLVSYLKIPVLITNAILSITENRIIILLLINVILLILGMIMDMASLILILTPVFMPIVRFIGMDPVHFGIVMILNLGIGLLTPPVGTTLFVGSAISGIPMIKIAKAMIPFYLVMVAVLLLITFIPDLVMYIPNKFMPL